MIANPTEHEEQCAVIDWCEIASHQYPELSLIFAIPNGGQRHVGVARKLKAEGVRSGAPDLFLPVARGIYHGLFVEMKRQKGGRLSDTQKDYFPRLIQQDYKVIVCNGADEAMNGIQEYLREEKR